MDWFANRGAGIRLARLDRNSNEIGRVAADVGEYFIGLPPFVPSNEVQCNRADLVFGALVATAGLRIHILDFLHAEDALFDLSDQVVLLNRGQIAARMNVDHGERLLDIREIFDAASKHRERDVHGYKQA